MNIIVDRRTPKQALEKLNKFGEVIPFFTRGITYEAISCHPDIFFCKIGDQVVVAPNLQDSYKNLLSGKNISFIEGKLEVGYKYPETTKYNVVATKNYIIHNFRYTDSVITSLCEDMDLIHVNQGYSRCNLLALKDDHFITSDKGISKVLNNFNLKHLFIEPSGILLPGHKHGFFGGTCGVFEDKVFISGSLSRFEEGKKIRDYIEALNYEIIELYDGPLFDGGSIFFV